VSRQEWRSLPRGRLLLQDGTILTLPDELRDHWRGSGETGGEAGLRVQLRINWSDGKLTGPWLQDARASENTGEATVEHTPLPKGALYLANSGYLILQRMRELDVQGDFWLTPARANLIITDQKGIRRDLPSFVASRSAEVIDEWVWVGADRQLYCQLLVFPDEEKAENLPIECVFIFVIDAGSNICSASSYSIPLCENTTVMVNYSIDSIPILAPISVSLMKISLLNVFFFL